MRRRSLDLRIEEIPNWVDLLIERLTPHGLESALRGYELCKTTSKPISRSTWVEQRHPWFEAILAYQHAGRTLRGISDQASAFAIERVAADSMKIETVLSSTTISSSTQTQLFRRLVQMDDACAALTEIEAAFHYWRIHGEICWIDSDCKDSEFIVKLNDLEFAVECKYIRATTGRPFRSEDFSHLLDWLVELLSSKEPLSGHILLELIGRLPEQPAVLKALAESICEGVTERREVVTLPNELGVARLNVRERSKLIVTTGDIHSFARSLAPEGAIHAVLGGGKDLRESPLIFSCVSKRPPLVYDRLGRTIKDATRQVGDRLGVIMLHYGALAEGDVERVKVLPRFNTFNNKWLARHTNILALVYVTGPFSREGALRPIVHEALQFKNPYVPEIKDLSFIFD